MKEIIKNYSDIFITLSAAIVMCGQYYLENIVGLEPCNLCILQKLSAQAIFFIFLLKTIVRKFNIIFDFLGLGVLIFGASASGRQIYLQNLPASQLTGGYCDIPFEFLFNMYPFFDALGKVFQGSSKCAEESWVFLYLNIPEWALLFFTSMILLLLVRYFLVYFKGQK
ncbi:MAG: disulfide bond formation protein B [Gammaproteobacteria bacterium TMED112]|nr:MAG: disulfide bond formation protein B [Gammaproteobacteria bacterium TMED112]